MEERLQKYLANNGIAARRKCEEYILEGRVKVNGKTVTELGTKIEPEKDSLRSKFLWISLYLVMKFDGKYTYEVKYVGQSIY